MQETTAEVVAAGEPAPKRPPDLRAQGAWRRLGRRLLPLAWVGPAAGLIVFAVIWPVYEMFQTSFQNISPIGIVLGSNGTKNYSTLFHEPAFGSVVVRTIIWTVVVVTLTMAIALPLAQLFNQRFPGRRVARWALIAPWAASVMMTAIVFRWMLDPNNGVINVLLHQLGIVKSFNSNTADWLGRPDAAMAWMMAVAVFVSLPFSTYTLLAGLQSIPRDIYEAARVDGASKLGTYRSITLPLLRRAALIATLINLMNVFNSFPIIWEMTGGGPGYETSTTTVFMYILKQSNIGEAGAMSVVNFGIVIVIVLAFLRTSRWKSEVN
jgi:multiple sugar transport system permease protein